MGVWGWAASQSSIILSWRRLLEAKWKQGFLSQKHPGFSYTSTFSCKPIKWWKRIDKKWLRSHVSFLLGPWLKYTHELAFSNINKTSKLVTDGRMQNRMNPMKRPNRNLGQSPCLIIVSNLKNENVCVCSYFLMYIYSLCI